MKKLFVLAVLAAVLAAGTVTVLTVQSQPAFAGPCGAGSGC